MNAVDQHATDCLCLTCAPVSQPTRSPSINDLLASGRSVELAQDFALLESLRTREREVVRDLMKGMRKLQGSRG